MYETLIKNSNKYKRYKDNRNFAFLPFSILLLISIVSIIVVDKEPKILFSFLYLLLPIILIGPFILYFHLKAYNLLKYQSEFRKLQGTIISLETKVYKKNIKRFMN